MQQVKIPLLTPSFRVLRKRIVQEGDTFEILQNSHVSNTHDTKYGKAKHSIGGGWLVLTHSSTQDKKKMLDKIASALHLNIKIEIIYNHGKETCYNNMNAMRTGFLRKRDKKSPW